MKALIKCRLSSGVKMPNQHVYVTKPDGQTQTQSISGKCLDCGKKWDGNNAHPVAKRHARVHNHRTVVNWEFRY